MYQALMFSKMDNIDIQATKGEFFTPRVYMNAEKGECELSGESYIEDTLDFYRPIVQWLQDYTTQVKKPLKFTFNLQYYNTSSSKYLLDIVKVLKHYADSGGDVKVTWFVPKDDYDMLEEVEDYVRFVGINIDIEQI
jgi:SiaC family regulatory phosphoprotein